MKINVESLVMRIDGRANLRRFFRHFLRSDLAWRASGLTYATAVVATTGSYSSREGYLSNLAERMTVFYPWLGPNDSVLEFGSGLGGNLLGLAPKVRRGYGVDLNPRFTRIATRLGKAVGASNVTFLTFDGGTVPRLYPLDLIVCIGVFERIPKKLVTGYVSQFRGLLSDNGRLIVYFLTREATDAGFGRVLGDGAYVTWQVGELHALFHSLGFRVETVMRRFLGAGDTYVLSLTSPGREGPNDEAVVSSPPETS